VPLVPARCAPVLFLLALTSFAAPDPCIFAFGARETLRQLTGPHFLSAGVAAWHVVRARIHLHEYRCGNYFYFYRISRGETKGFIPFCRIYSMGIGRYMAKELAKELDSKSREFFEFVMPAIDMAEDGNELAVVIDCPGFAKKDISLRIAGNILSISAKREQEESLGTVYYRHRPLKIDKKIILPISVKEDEKIVGKATYENGVVTLRIPIPKSTNIPIA